MFVQTIMLLLGGFAIASAFTKHFIAKRMATWVLSKVSSKPQYVLIANMLVATFASMWITNVAAPVLCFSLLQPILRTLPSGHTFAKSLVLGRQLLSTPDPSAAWHSPTCSAYASAMLMFEPVPCCFAVDDVPGCHSPLCVWCL